MSPSANELEHNIGRPLKKGDILIDNDGTAFEITNPKIPAGRGKSRSGTIFEGSESVGFRHITPLGTSEIEDATLRTWNAFSGVIKREKRTDISPLKKLLFNFKK
jgi:hypothetical protein